MHENRDPADNRWDNLRPSTDLKNARNKSLRRDNSSGQVEVRQSGASWIAQIGDDYLGSFSSFDEAQAERLAEQAERGFAQGHGAPRKDAHA